MCLNVMFVTNKLHTTFLTFNEREREREEMQRTSREILRDRREIGFGFKIDDYPDYESYFMLFLIMWWKMREERKKKKTGMLGVEHLRFRCAMR